MASGSNAGDWCLIESDPGVLTELVRGFGVTGVQVEELWSLGPEDCVHLQPMHGLVFLFKWLPGDEASGPVVRDPQQSKGIWFAKQVINNACATQALLSVLLNIGHPDVQIGETLSSFKEFVADFDSTMKGLALSNSDLIRSVHNSFARQNMFEFENVKKEKNGDDVFHFISYVPIAGRLYELDGLKDGPIDLGPIARYDASKSGSDSESGWMSVARPVIEKRIQRYSEGEIHFNLMAIVSDRKTLYEKQLQELENKVTMMETEDSDNETVLAMAHLRDQIQEEEGKRQRHRMENIRRRHNYLPLIMEILKSLGQEGHLTHLLDQAKAKSQSVERVKQQQKNKRMKTQSSAGQGDDDDKQPPSTG